MDRKSPENLQTPSAQVEQWLTQGVKGNSSVSVIEESHDVVAS